MSSNIVEEESGRHTVRFSIEGEASDLVGECEALETIEAVVARLGDTHGRPELTTFRIFVENTDGETVATATVHEVLGGKRRGRLHLHRCKRISIAVEFQSGTRHHDFAPGTTIHEVLRFAVGKNEFNVEGEVHDLALQVAGTTTLLQANTHIGTLVQHDRCELRLELVAKDRPQG